MLSTRGPFWLLLAIWLGAAVPACAQGTTASKTVDAMNTLWGRFPGISANHGKGIVTE
jgi:hypothetical protein